VKELVVKRLETLVEKMKVTDKFEYKENKEAKESKQKLSLIELT